MAFPLLLYSKLWYHLIIRHTLYKKSLATVVFQEKFWVAKVVKLWEKNPPVVGV